MKDAKRAAKKLHRIDRKLSRRAARARDHDAVRVAATVGELADQPPLIAITAATAVVGAVIGNARIVRVGVRMLASHLLATGIKAAVKHRIDRTRPHAEQDGRAYRLQPGDSHDHELNSFPSGHTAGAAAVARALTRDVPGAALPAAAAAGAVAAIQLPNGKHYATDVAAGAAIGLVAEWLVNAAVEAIDRRITDLRTPAQP